ncbi:hypothetical protein ACMD2_15888 [Ananas comosus]|uniref:Uncharacterized protein n=1 Tax=Ananas comosus TaxID=4615 RepID=A0A199V5Q7_ANACO|nr:hypothetical protein ACMD2_15888 [Ananas comosus]
MFPLLSPHLSLPSPPHTMDLMRWIQISSNLPSPLTVSYEYAIVFFSGIQRLLDEIYNGKRVDEWLSMRSAMAKGSTNGPCLLSPIPMTSTIIYHTNFLDFVLLLPNPAIAFVAERLSEFYEVFKDLTSRDGLGFYVTGGGLVGLNPKEGAGT